MTSQAAPTVDYAPVIRAELEREVERLITKFERYNPNHEATRVEIGYLVGCHKGVSVLGEEPVTIAGLPMRRVTNSAHVVRVHGEDDNDSRPQSNL